MKRTVLPANMPVITSAKRSDSSIFEPVANQNPASILWAAISWGHMGSHSGIAPLTREVEGLMPGLVERVDGNRKGSPFLNFWASRFRRLTGWFQPWTPVAKSVPLYTEASWLLEKRIGKIVRRAEPSVVVLASIEEQLFELSRQRRIWPRTRLVGISHQPPAWWRLHHGHPAIVRDLDTLVILASSARAYWEGITSADRIALMPLGVDADFFSPSPAQHQSSYRDRSLRVICCGHWLRDFDVLAQVVAMTDELELLVEFDLVVPIFARANQACYRIAMSPRVRWHADLKDEDLRDLYRQSDLLLLALLDSTANCALLEGMACGLPAIVTDVGGVCDYATEHFADLVQPGDARRIIELLKYYVVHRDRLTGRGSAARARVEDHFTWKNVADRFVTLLLR